MLKSEADALIKKELIAEVLGSNAKIEYSGSYALDLMVYPDIDLYLDLPDKSKSFEYIGGCAAHYISSSPSCVRVKVEKQYHVIRPHLPKGLFLSLKFSNQKWRMPWKFDIWLVDSAYLAEHLSKIAEYQRLLDAESREIILKFKHKFITQQGRTGSFGNHHIYDAVLKYKINSYEKLLGYLNSLGIDPTPAKPSYSVFSDHYLSEVSGRG